MKGGILAPKTPQTLRRYVLKVQSIIALVIVFSYTLVINFYFVHGLNEANFQDLHLETNHFAKQYQASTTVTVPDNLHFKGFIGWKQLPHWAKGHFGALEHVTEMTMAHTRVMSYENIIPWPEQVIFIIAQPLFDGKKFYLLRKINTKHYDSLSQMGISKMIKLTWPIALVFLIIMHFSVQLLLNRTLKPFYQLGDWVEQLTLENVEHSTPDFEFYELSVIAEQQKKALLRLSSMLDKEQAFLRHASHELRTPIAVVKSNSELLTRILEKQNIENNPHKEQQSLARISRAALTMQHTTETLLWLSQESDTAQNNQHSILAAEVDLSKMINNLIEDNAYLLQSKQVKVIVNLPPATIKVFATPCRLILNNLIRNAFQYTAEGQVSIECHQSEVTVENININSGVIDHEGADYGYGLGLRLVEKIVKKMHWPYQNIEIIGGRNARVDFTSK